MPPRRRIQFTQDSIDQQLQQIHLLDPSSSSENLEQLGPIIKQIHQNRQQDAFLRTLQGLMESKELEIEKICGDNYQDFVESVSTLFTIKSYTNNLRDKITTLDASVAQVGRGLVEKKRALLESKKTAANLDEAIDTLQACLRVLDVVNRVGQMIKEQKYWSALRVCIIVHSVMGNANPVLKVTRRSLQHASQFFVANAAISTSHVVTSLITRPGQRRRHGVDKAMAARDPKCQRQRRKAGN